MIKSTDKETRLEGSIATLTIEVIEILTAFYRTAVNQVGEEEANKLYAYIGNISVLTEEEQENEAMNPEIGRRILGGNND